MALNNDDLQRLRDAIDKGWDFTMCHELDFAAAVSELVDLAMEGGATLAQKVYDCFGDAPDLARVTSLLQGLIDDVEDCGSETVKGIDNVIELLDAIDTSLGDRYEKAEALL